MSAFTGLFVKCILWGGAWHFAAYPIDKFIKRRQWAYITRLVVGIVSAYPFIEAFIVKAASLCGFSDADCTRLRPAIFVGYFGTFTSYGIGKVIFTAFDPVEH